MSVPSTWFRQERACSPPMWESQSLTPGMLRAGEPRKKIFGSVGIMRERVPFLG